MLKEYALSISNPTLSVIALILFVLAFIAILLQFFIVKKSEYDKRADIVLNESISTKNGTDDENKS